MKLEEGPDRIVVVVLSCFFLVGGIVFLTISSSGGYQTVIGVVFLVLALLGAAGLFRASRRPK